MSCFLAWFSTGRGSGSRNLFSSIKGAIDSGYLCAKISFVFSNRALFEAEGSDNFFKLVLDSGIPLVSLSSRQFKKELKKEGKKDPEKLKIWRDLYDKKVDELISHIPFDVVVLAGYMLILGEYFVKKYKAINLHPALPSGPKGEWVDVMWELIEKRAKETGAMVHLATEDLDRGPVISYTSFSLETEEFLPLWERLENDLKIKSIAELRRESERTYPLFVKIREEEAKREIPLLIETIKAISENRIKIAERKITDGFGCELLQGLCLNDEIERYLYK